MISFFQETHLCFRVCRFDIALQFAESKESPVASFISAILKQQTPLGQPVDPKSELVKRFIPLVWQDANEAMKEYGIAGAATAVPAVFGVGTQTYGTPKFDINKMYNVPTYMLLDQLEKLPPEQANQIAKRIKKERPDKFASLKRARTYNQLKLTPLERGLVDKSVWNGARAQAVAQEINKLKTPQEKNEYVKRMKDAGIVTDQIVKQLKLLRQQGKL